MAVFGKIRVGPVGRNSDGQIVVDFPAGDTKGIGLDVGPTPASGSERAAIKIGNFQLVQDTAGDGTTNFGILDVNDVVLASYAAGVPAIVSELPATKYTAVATATAFAATGAQVAGGDHTVLNLTGTLAADRILTTPTPALLVAAIAGAAAGQTYRLRIINSSADVFTWTVAAGVGVTLVGDVLIPKDTWREFNVTLTTLAAVSMQSVGTGTQFPQLLPAKYSAASDTIAFSLTAAQVAGAQDVVVNLTGTLGAGAAVTFPTATNLVAAIPGATVGQSYKLRLVHSGAGDYAWTATQNTGITLSGTMTIAKGESRDFVVVLTSLTAVAITAAGSGISKDQVTTAIAAIVPDIDRVSQINIPLIVAPSGSFGDNGALTSGTVNPLIYLKTYTWFPAAAIVAGGAAGWYYTVWTSTTEATVYNDTWAGTTVPTIPVAPLPFSTTGPGAFTGPTTEAVYLAMPMAISGVTDAYELELRTHQTNNANTKTVRARFSIIGGTALGTLTITSFAHAIGRFGLRLLGVADKQEATFERFTTAAYASDTPALRDETTSVAWSWAITVEKATDTDVVVIESLRIIRS